MSLPSEPSPQETPQALPTLQQWADDLSEAIKEYPLGLQGELEDVIELSADVLEAINQLKEFSKVLKKQIKKMSPKPSKSSA